MKCTCRYKAVAITSDEKPRIIFGPCHKYGPALEALINRAVRVRNKRTKRWTVWRIWREKERILARIDREKKKARNAR